MRRIFIFVLFAALLLMLLNCKSKHNSDCDAYGSTEVKNKNVSHGGK